MPVEASECSRQLTARAGLSTYVILGTFSMIFTIMAVVGSLRSGQWELVGLAVPTAAAVFLWIASFKLEVSGGTLKYRTLLGGTRTIGLVDVSSADTDIGPSAPFGPFYRLTLFPMDKRVDPLVINMKVFSQRDLQRLFQILGPKLKSRRTALIRGKQRQNGE